MQISKRTLEPALDGAPEVSEWAALRRSLSNVGVSEHLLNDAICVPMREFLERPTKAVRVRMVDWGWRLAGRDGAAPSMVGVLLQLLHTGSLIVDDIEDQSSWRRGGAALHRCVGEARAINLGNLLYFVCYDVLTRLELPASSSNRLFRAITSTAIDAHVGQGIDLSARLSQIEQASVAALADKISHLKTGSLTGLATAAGAIAAGATPGLEQQARRLGRRFGVLLQILDDVGGVIAGERKQKGLEDLSNGRVSWCWSLAAEALDAEEYRRLASLSHSVEEGTRDAEDLLTELRPIVAQTWRPWFERQSDRALAEIHRDFDEPAVLRDVRAELAGITRSFVDAAGPPVLVRAGAGMGIGETSPKLGSGRNRPADDGMTADGARVPQVG